MRNLKGIMIILLIGLLAVGFFSSCADADTGMSDAEKAVLINKAIDDAGTEPKENLSSNNFDTNNTSFSGSQFYDTDVDTWPLDPPLPANVNLLGLSYTNLTVAVQDDDGNNITVVLNGSINYGFYLAADSSMTMIIFGTITGSVDGESFNFAMDLKTSYSDADKTYTITGTAGGVTINESYTVTSM
ncbi:MAG: hypothetical protein KAH95_02440 [Spirochaetales bacterium]|nr:hypothetical protein [Spirochaetales bacterium]